MEEQYQTLQEVAQRLNVSEKTIHRKLESGLISAKFIANRWRFTEPEVQAYILRCKRKDSKGIAVKRKYIKKGA